MGNLRILVSLMTDGNDYQREQAAAAQEAGRRLGIDVQVAFAGTDAVDQSQQLLNVIQSNGRKPDGMAVFPLSATGLGQVAKIAVQAGIGWTLINRKVDYINGLRASTKLPVFQVTSDHTEIGRIQGRQIAALLPNGGIALSIQGPASASAAEERTVGMNETKPSNVQVRSFRANWTEKGAYAAVSSWLRLSTSHSLAVEVVAAQNDDMAIGARRAFEHETSGAERERWLSVPFLGCDGLPLTGQAAVRNKILAATIVNPPTAGLAVETLANALRNGTQPPETIVLAPSSYPVIEQLRASKALV